MDIMNWLTTFIAGWKLSNTFKKMLLERENYLCCYCGANFRMRIHAKTVLNLLNMSNTDELLYKLKNDASLHIYETAAYNIFRNSKFSKFNNYIISEYFDDESLGTCVKGIRNENLERLTFPDNKFDIVINSDVLEHVGNLEQALWEVKRVLKPGGFHVFTIPVDYELPITTERARIVDGKVVHLMEPVMHGDSIRGEGILAFRDFGKDVLDYMSREGFQCNEFRYYIGNAFVTSVYYAQKQ
jgi:SAM-dependent methyltransferase